MTPPPIKKIIIILFFKNSRKKSICSAVVDLLFIVTPIVGVFSVIVLCFVVRYFLPFLLLQSS